MTGLQGRRAVEARAIASLLPPGARRALHLGCGDGTLGAALKALQPGLSVQGVECAAGAVAQAAGRLDGAVAFDLRDGLPPLPADGFDAVVAGGVVARLPAPAELLRACRALLRPGGVLVVSLPNPLHHEALRALLGGNLDRPPRQALTHACVYKILLDAGYLPDIASRVSGTADPGLHEAIAPLLTALRINARHFHWHLDTQDSVFLARPLPAEDEAAPARPITLVVGVTDELVLRAQLLASPDLADGRHQVLLLRERASAAEAIDQALAEAAHDLVVWAHQDVYLPRGWVGRFQRRWAEAVASLGPLGLAGVYGVRRREERVERAGQVIDRLRLLNEPLPLPAAVDSLDELLLALPRGSPLRADPALGFHLYGTDLALRARERGLAVAALAAPCLHNSRGNELPPEFFTAANVFFRRWRHALPISTPCISLFPDGRLRAS